LSATARLFGPLAPMLWIINGTLATTLFRGSASRDARAALRFQEPLYLSDCAFSLVDLPKDVSVADLA